MQDELVELVPWSPPQLADQVISPMDYQSVAYIDDCYFSTVNLGKECWKKTDFKSWHPELKWQQPVNHGYFILFVSAQQKNPLDQWSIWRWGKGAFPKLSVLSHFLQERGALSELVHRLPVLVEPTVWILLLLGSFPAHYICPVPLCDITALY